MFAAGALEISLREVLGACWVVMKSGVVFQVAVLIVPLITDHNKAMVWSSAKGVSNAHTRHLAKAVPT